jgi:WD40 repeat protein
LIDYKKLSRIKKDFKLRKDGLLRQEFMTIMLHHLPEFKDKVKLVSSLNELFSEIDVNDDGFLEWDEFSNYIIEKGLLRNDQKFLEVIKSYSPAYWRDEVKHENEIDYMQFLPELKHLIVCERDSKKFKVYNMKNGKFMKEVAGHTGSVLGAAYIPRQKTVLTSGNDLFINMWDETNYSLKYRFKCKNIPLVLSWNDHNNTLYTGAADNVIYSYRIGDIDRLANTTMVKGKEISHPFTISSILPLNDLNMLASADLSGKILLWDLSNHSLVRRMRDLDKGICALDYDPSTRSLFSAGLDRDAYVWNPYVQKWIFKLSGHIHSLTDIKFIPNTFQLVTADITGMFKIWDVRTFTCIQSFQAPVGELNCFTVTYPEKKIIAGSRKLVMYSYEEPKDHGKVDESHAIACIYNSHYQVFFTAHANCVKSWNASNGSLKIVFRDLTPGEITALELDNRQRKLYIGDSRGNVLSINAKNGALIKKFKNHAGQVSDLVYWPEFKFLISCSWDGCVRIHDDSRADDFGVVRFDKIKHRDHANAVCLKSKGRLIASAADDKTIIIFNLRNLRQEAELKDHLSEVKCVKFLNPHNCLVSTDLDGTIYFWGVAPSKFKHELLITTKNEIITSTGKKDFCPIQALTFYAPDDILITGDDVGHIKIWNVLNLLKRLEAAGTRKSKKNKVEKPEETREATTIIGKNTYLTAIALEVIQDSTILFTQRDVDLAKSWKAHSDSIVDITIVESPLLIISCSFDSQTFIWNFSAQKIGSLVIGGDPHWGVSPDFAGKIEKERSFAQKMLGDIDQTSYFEVVTKLGRGEGNETEDEELQDLGKVTDIDRNPSKHIIIPSASRKETKTNNRSGMLPRNSIANNSFQRQTSNRSFSITPRDTSRSMNKSFLNSSRNRSQLAHAGLNVLKR